MDGSKQGDWMPPNPWCQPAPCPPGFFFRHFLKFCFMVWDLSRSVFRVFRSPGNPLINLFDFICNKKCLLYCLVNCLLYCLLYGQGSWAGPAWFWLGGAKGPGPDRLGFGLGGQGSWAGPAWFWLGGAKGPGPGRLGS